MKANSILIVLALLLTSCAFVWGYNIGSARDVKSEYMSYVKANDTGCDEILREQNHYTGKLDLVCEITMHTEDDALFVIKKPGTKEEY